MTVATKLYIRFYVVTQLHIFSSSSFFMSSLLTTFFADGCFIFKICPHRNSGRSIIYDLRVAKKMLLERNIILENDFDNFVSTLSCGKS